MRRTSSLQLAVVGVLTVATAVVACKKDDPPPQTAQPYGQPYGQPSAYPQGQPTAYPPQGQPTAAPPPGGQMAVPGPAALPCQNDSQCLTHKCNTQYGKCAWPCQSDIDCIQGSKCQVGLGAVATCLAIPGQ